jgi:membrane carboxypeptidase/penicillin-binding protein
VLQGQPTPERSIAPYFVEDIRKMLEQKYGADTLYQAGLRVQTTARRQAAGSGERSHRSRFAHHRQAQERLPPPEAQHHCRG